MTTDGFDHILNWRLLRGSHAFPGPDGGTCINEAAVVACGFPYRPIAAVDEMPSCFSRPICRLALRLNDDASDAERHRLLPFVTRLACADTAAVEAERAAYVARYATLRRRLFGFWDIGRGCAVLDGALAIGRRAEQVEPGEAAARLRASRRPDAPSGRGGAHPAWSAPLVD